MERIERGSAQVTVATLTAAMAAVGLDLVLHSYPGQAPRVRDARHALLVDHLRRASASHWHPRIEVAAGDHGRSADLVLFGSREVLHFEIERRIVDVQLQLRSAKRKREALTEANADRPVRLVLVIQDTRRNRAALHAHLPLLASQLPRTSRQITRSLRTGDVLGADGLLWLRAPPVAGGTARRQ